MDFDLPSHCSSLKRPEQWCISLEEVGREVGDPGDEWKGQKVRMGLKGVS
jgi:hypothetical protein